MTEVLDFKAPYSAQGDLNIFVFDKIPDGLSIDKKEDGKFILAHSETGHHHVIDARHAKVFRENAFVSYLEVKEKSNIVHLRSFDTHKTISVPPGIYRLTNQREYTPEGWRRAAD